MENLNINRNTEKKREPRGIKVQIVLFKNGNYNNNDNHLLQNGYRVVYILTKLGQPPFMLFIRIS